MDRPSPELLPARFQLTALIVAIVGWVGMVALGIHFAGQTRPGPFDASLMHAAYAGIGRRSTFSDVLLLASNPVLTYAVIALVLGYGLWRRRWDVAALAVLGPGLATLLVELPLKPVFGRRYEGDLSFPSGHTTSSVAALTVALLVLLGLVGSRAVRVLLVVIWVGLVACVVTGLVSADYHYPTDTVGGIALALGVVLPLAVLATRFGQARRAAASRESATSRETARRYFLR